MKVAFELMLLDVICILINDYFGSCPILSGTALMYSSLICCNVFFDTCAITCDFHGCTKLLEHLKAVRTRSRIRPTTAPRLGVRASA